MKKKKKENLQVNSAYYTVKDHLVNNTEENTEKINDEIDSVAESERTSI